MEPVLKPKPKLLILDDKILLSVVRANVLSQITVSSMALKLCFYEGFFTHEQCLYIQSPGTEPAWQQSEQAEGHFPSHSSKAPQHQL